LALAKRIPTSASAVYQNSKFCLLGKLRATQADIFVFKVN